MKLFGPRVLARLLPILLLGDPVSAHAQAAAGWGACGEPEAREAGFAMVLGTVRDGATGVPLPGAWVLATWIESGEGRQIAEAEADAEGRYEVCGLPLEVKVTLEAHFSVIEGDPVVVRVEEGAVVRDLELHLVKEDSRSAQIVGRVVDRKSGRPVTAATVALTGTKRLGETNRQGYFVLRDLPAGVYRVRVEHLGYAPAEETVAVPSGRTVEVTAELSAEPVELEPIMVTTVRDRRLEIKGFYERKRWGERLGLGHFITREDIERRMPLRISHMIAEYAGVVVVGGRVRMSRAPFCRSAKVLLDGMRVGGPDAVHPNDVGGVEIYKGPASIPGEFTGSDARCGVVVIWTRGM